MTASKWPERIYLQRDYECAEEGCGPHDMSDGGETTWCKDKIHDTDVEYVRADLRAAEPPTVTPSNPMVEALRNITAALLSDPPHGPQKSIYADETIYHLDGQRMYAALKAARDVLDAHDRQSVTKEESQ